MSPSTKRQGRGWSRFHFLTRLAGLTALLAVGAGAALAFLQGMDLRGMESLEQFREALLGRGDIRSRVAAWLLAGGGAIVLIALLVELFVLVFLTATRRSATGLNATVQVALAIALLVLVNWYSFDHYLRFDWTRDRQFTLPAELQDQLRKLQGKTMVVVYQQHKTFGSLSDKADARNARYFAAADQRVVEKVYDLIDQVRELGAQFDVVVLDVQDEEFDDRRDKLPAELREALENAPDNSIFFYNRPPGRDQGHVQRLSFNALYQIDIMASREDNDKRGNLVLRHQDRGIETFARRLLNIEARRPKVAVVAGHRLLATQSNDPLFNLKGLAKSLTTYGFDVVDLLTKKGSASEPAAYTSDEYRFDFLEAQLAFLREEIKELEDAGKEVAELRKKVGAGDEKSVVEIIAIQQQQANASRGVLLPLARLRQVIGEQYRKLDAGRKKAVREDALAFIDRQHDALKKELAERREDESKKVKERDALNVESVAELRRTTDLRAKMDRLLADVDLVIVPRFTIQSIAPPGATVPSDIHRLDPVQAGALKKFMAGGKPLLVCFGPTNERRRPGAPPGMPAPGSQPDDLEQALNDLGIRFGKHVVFYNAEAQVLAALVQEDDSLLGADEPVPPVEFEAPRHTGSLLFARGSELAVKRPNPIAESLRIASHGVGKPLNLQLRVARPVYYVSAHQDETLARLGAQTAGLLAAPFGSGVLLAGPAYAAGQPRDELPYAAEIMWSNEKSWNEDRPFPERRPFAEQEYYPRPPREGAGRGTLDTKGVGPFPLGVAIETQAPAEWAGTAKARPEKVRVAAIGHGHLFVGNTLPPAEEKLLIDTSNWLVGRDDLLTREEPDDPSKGIWKYPRLTHLTERQQQLWHWGALLGLPALFAYLGLAVVLVRRLR